VSRLIALTIGKLRQSGPAVALLKQELAPKRGPLPEVVL
jgi:hypothetical protein